MSSEFRQTAAAGDNEANQRWPLRESFGIFYFLPPTKPLACLKTLKVSDESAFAKRAKPLRNILPAEKRLPGEPFLEFVAVHTRNNRRRLKDYQYLIINILDK